MKISKSRYVPVFLIFFISFNISFAQEKTPISGKRDATNFILSSSDNNGFLKTQSESSRKNLSSLSDNKNEKSPVLAGLFSAIIPGSGEIYSKSYIKAAVFLAIEAGMWLGYKSLQNKGDDQTVFFQNEADQKWSIQRYARWLQQEGAQVDPTITDFETLRAQINVFESAHFSHTLPPHGVQQYYELIGKYHSFVAGWEDAEPQFSQYHISNYIDWATPLYTSYSFDRQQANNYYDRSETFIYGVIVNHVLSLADAVWSVSIFNKSLQFNSKFQMSDSYSYVSNKRELVPTSRIAITF